MLSLESSDSFQRYHRTGERFGTQIHQDCTKQFLGDFDTPEEAALVRAKAKWYFKQIDESRAKALVDSIPRDKLLGALGEKSETVLNKLIDLYGVNGCHKLEPSGRNGVYKRVQKLVLEDLGSPRR